MKTIIAGGRDITDFSQVVQAVSQSGFTITEVVSGRQRGVDTLGEQYADLKKLPIAPFPADWTAHGKAAGPIRNAQMARYADALIAIWDGESKGTKNMINQAKKEGLMVFVYMIDTSTKG